MLFTVYMVIGNVGQPILTPEEKLDAIGTRLRRQVLLALYLRDPTDDDPVNARAITDSDSLDSVTLYHTELPKLNNYGLVDWERETGTLSRGPDFETITPLLTVLYDHQSELPANWFDSE